MNIISISGNLGKDCEVRSLSDGTQIASFSVADSQGKDKPSIWWNASLFGKRVAGLAPYLVKGQTVTINGTVSEREYKDKDGNQRKSMDVRVNDIALQGGKRDQSESGTTPSPRPQAQRTAPAGAFDDMDSDIPF